MKGKNWFEMKKYFKHDQNFRFTHSTLMSAQNDQFMVGIFGSTMFIDTKGDIF